MLRGAVTALDEAPPLKVPKSSVLQEDQEPLAHKTHSDPYRIHVWASACEAVNRTCRTSSLWSCTDSENTWKMFLEAVSVNELMLRALEELGASSVARLEGSPACAQRGKRTKSNTPELSLGKTLSSSHQALRRFSLCTEIKTENHTLHSPSPWLY